MEELRTFLGQLHSSIGEDTLADLKRVSESLLTFVRTFDPGEDHAAVADLLFSEDSGLLAACDKILVLSSADLDDAQESLSNILQTFRELLSGTRGHLGDKKRALHLKTTALTVESRVKKAKIKEYCLALLVELLDVHHSVASEGAWKIDDLILRMIRNMNSTRFSPTVKREGLRLLGKIAEKFPRCDQDSIRKVLISLLKSQMDPRNKKVENSILTGCLEGMTGLWTHLSIDEELASDAELVFRCAVSLLRPEFEFRKAGETPRAALNLLAKHAYVFVDQIFNDAEKAAKNVSNGDLYEKLVGTWCRHTNSYSAKAGRYALDAYLKVLCGALIKYKDDAGKSGKLIFRYFVGKLEKMAANPEISPKDLGTCIKGYGFFARPCSAYYSGDELNHYFRGFVDFGVTNLLETADEKRFGVLSDFFTSLGAIVLALETDEAQGVVKERLPTIQRLAVKLMEEFPDKLHPQTQKIVAPSLLAFVYALEAKRFREARGEFLAVVIRQSMIRTCCHGPVVEEDANEKPNGEAAQEDQPPPKVSRFSGWTDQVTYESYVHVWVKLLSGLGPQELARYGMGPDDFSKDELPEEFGNFNCEIVRETIACVLQLVDDLDLKTEQLVDDEEEVPETTAEAPEAPVEIDSTVVGLVPSNVDDLAIFANLVEFSNLVLFERATAYYRHVVKKAMPVWLEAAMNGANRRPLISGFYKMIRSGFLLRFEEVKRKDEENEEKVTPVKREAEELNDDDEPMAEEDEEAAEEELNGEDEPVANGADEEATEDVDEGIEEDDLEFREKVRNFLAKVLVRCRQFTDELLLSCLRMICAAPIDIMEGFLKDLVSLIKVVFEKGLNYLPLADEGLAALKRWPNRLSSSSKRTLFTAVVPSLELYLRSVENASDELLEFSADKRLPKTAAARRKRRLKLMEKKRAAGLASKDFVSLSDVQTAVLEILGGFCLSDAVVSKVVLGGNERMDDTTGQEAWSVTGAKAAGFNVEPPLDFAVPFPDVKPKIAIDRFIPRIVQLALEASDRKTRIAACETLHSIVIYMIGMDAEGGEDTPPALEKTRRLCIFPALLRLGAEDGDMAVKSIFRPLVCQLTRWFLANTGKPKQAETNARALLDGILGAIVERGSSSLRNAAAEYLKDFFVAAKETAIRRKGENFMEVILDWMASQALHSNPHRRFGAAFAFHAIHAEFRESGAVNDRYCFYLFASFVKALDASAVLSSGYALKGASGENLEEDSSGLDVLERSLNHLRRAMAFTPRRRSKLASTARKDVEDRVPVPEIHGKLTLDAFMEWLFKQCFSGHPSLAASVSMAAKKKQDICISTLDYLTGKIDTWGTTRILVALLVEKLQDDIRESLKRGEALVQSMNFLAWIAGILGPKDLQFESLFVYFSSTSLETITDIESKRITQGILAALLRLLTTVDRDSVEDLLDKQKRAADGLLLQLASMDDLKGVVDLLKKLGHDKWGNVLKRALSGSFTREDVERLFNMEYYGPSHEKKLNRLKELASANPSLLPRGVIGYCWEAGVEQLLAFFNEKHTKNPAILKYARALLRFCLSLDEEQGASVVDYLTSFSSNVDCRYELYQRVAAPGKSDVGEILDILIGDAFSTYRTREPGDNRRDAAFELLVGALSVDELDENGIPSCWKVLKALVDQWHLVSSWYNSLTSKTKTSSAMNNDNKGEEELVRLGKEILAAHVKIETQTVEKNVADKPDLSPVASYFVEDFITDRKVSVKLGLTAQLIEFFAIYCGDCQKKHCRDDCTHRRAVAKTIADNFPFRSTEYQKNSPDWAAHRRALEAFFVVFKRTRDPVIFRHVAQTILVEDNHEHEVTLDVAVVDFAEMQSEQVPTVLDYIWNTFFWGRDKKTDRGGSAMEKLRRKMLSRVVCRVLELCGEAQRLAFARAHMKDIMRACILDFDFSGAPDCFAGLHTSFDRLEAFLTLKRGCFQLLEVIIRTLPKELTDENSRLSALAVDRSFEDAPNESEEEVRDRLQKSNTASSPRLNKDLILAAKAFIEGKPMAREAQTALQDALRSSSGEESKTAGDSLREARCWALNCMLACLRKHLKTIDAFKLAFPAKRDMDVWWSNLIDVDQEIKFETELEQYPQRMKFSTASGRRLDDANKNRRRKRPWETGGSGFSGSASLKFLGDSTLSRDVSQFDFSNAGSAPLSDYSSQRPTRTEGKVKRVEFAKTETHNGGIPVDSNAEKGDAFEIEMDVMNQHPCMAQLTSALRFVLSTKEGRAAAEKSPPAMLTVLTNVKTAILYARAPNVKKFMSKLIYNCRDVLQPWGVEFVDAALELIVGEVVGSSLNYVTLDLSVMALEWTKDAKLDPSMQGVISRYVEFIVSKCGDLQRSDIRRSFIDVLEKAISKWKEVVLPPVETFSKLLSDPRETHASKSAKMDAALQSLAAFLIHGLFPYPPEDEDKYQLLRGVQRFLESRKDLPSLRLAAEVVGLLLKELSRDKNRGPRAADWSATSEFVTAVVRHVSGLAKSPIPLIRCLDRMRVHYPTICGRFITPLANALPKLDADSRAVGLEMIAIGINVQNNLTRMVEGDHSGSSVTFSAVDRRVLDVPETGLISEEHLRSQPFADNPAGFAKSVDLLKLLKQRHPASQTGAVILFDKLAPLFGENSSVFEDFATAVVEAGLSTDARCRSEVFNVCTRLFDRSTTFATALRRGMNDADPKLRMDCMQFWSTKINARSVTTSRFSNALSSIYSPETEPRFVSNTLYLVLELTSESPDYRSPAFTKPLSDHATFSAYSIPTRSRRTQASLVMPMFTQAASSRRRGTRSVRTGLDPSVMATVRSGSLKMLESGSASGSAGGTAPGGGDEAFGRTLTQDRFDISQSQSDGMDWVTQRAYEPSYTSGTDELDGGSSLFAARGRKRTHGDAFVKPLPPGSAPVEDDLIQIKRRFVKSQEGEDKTIFFIKREEQKKVDKEKRLAAEKAKQIEGVQLLRTYTVGQVPDVQIPHMDFVRPLEKLSELDAPVAKLLFASLVTSMASGKSASAARFAEQVSDALGRVLTSSTMQHAPLIAGICDILWSLPGKIKLDFKYLARCATSAGVQLAAVAAIEEFLISHLSEGGVRVKFSLDPKRTWKTKENKKAWLRLIEMYDGLDETDVSRDLFEKMVDVSPMVADAFHAAADRNYVGLKKALNAVAKNNKAASAEEVDVLATYRSMCLVKLADVTELVKMKGGRSGKQSLEWIWDDQEFLDRYLPLLFKNTLKKAGDDEAQEDVGKLQDFVQDAFNGPEASERSEILEAGYGYELALIRLLKGQYALADRILKKRALKGLAANWSSVSAMNRRERLARIYELHRVTDLKAVLDVASRKSDSGKKFGLWELFETWSSPDAEVARLPAKGAPMEVWDDVISYRLILVKGLWKKLDVLVKPMEDLISRMKFQLKLHAAKAATERGDAAAFKHWLAEAESATNSIQEGVQVRLLRLERSLADARKEGADLKAKKKFMKDFVKWTNAPDEPYFWDFAAKAAEFIADQIEKDPDCFADLVGTADDFMDAFQLGDDEELTNVAAVNGLLDFALKMLIKCVKKEDTVERHMRLFDFCREHLDREELGERDEPLSKVAMRSLLFGLKQEAKDAWQMIPVGLQLLVTHQSETVHMFSAEVEEIPTWLFLHWIPQMTGMLHMKESKPLRPVLLKIAEKYPQALYYPLTCSIEGAAWQELGTHVEVRRFAQKLRAMVDFPVLNDLVRALSYVSASKTVMYDFLEAVKMCSSSESPPEKYVAIAEEMKRFFVDAALPHDMTQEPLRGRYFDEVCKRRNVEAIIDRLAKFPDVRKADRRDEAVSIMRTLQAACKAEEKLAIPADLKAYSPWLASTSFVGKGVELPGQYVGFKKPDDEGIVMLAGFNPEVTTMPSLRMPKVVTVRGSDNAERKWVVKYGEDLRMDERIQKLFGIMNDIFAAHPACNEDPAGDCFLIETYMVVPLTESLGLIGWVENTVVLSKAILKNEADKKCENEAYGVYVANVTEFMKKAKADHINRKETYDKMYTEVPDSASIWDPYEAAVSKMPWDMLRNFFVSMARSCPSSGSTLASSAATFYALRSRFTVSWAVMSVGHWILGIGDRHLGNTLLSTRNGAAVGIDFGRTFGFATMTLPIPELMPIRLTPQILGVMAPYGEMGKFKSAMTKSLAALRKNQKVLLATMSVFVWEPSLDWTRTAVAAGDQGREDLLFDEEATTVEKTAWYPDKIVGFVKDRLNGANPVSVMKREIDFGRKGVEADKNYIRVLQRKDAKRNEYPASGLTAEEQVECIIDQATDVAILGRTFHGWRPFI